MTHRAKFTILTLVAALCWCTSLSYADTVYETDFSTFTDGNLAGQDGWEAQADWQVVSGSVMTTSSWTRSRQFNSLFAMQPGDVIRHTTNVCMTGTPGTDAFFRLGISKDNEHTGANLPQLGINVSWSGTSLNVGGVVDNGYDSGDEVSIELTFIMQANTNQWHVNVRLNNITDGTSFEGGSQPADSAGSVTTETAWEWLNTGNSGRFGMRMLNNSGLVEVAVKSVKYENNLPAEDLLGVVVFDSDFSSFTDGPLAGQNTWEGQPTWQIAGGMLTGVDNFQRARKLSPFTMLPGDVIRFTAEMSLTGTPGTAEIVRLGISNSLEHVGATVPQVFAGITWNGTDLTVGGATDTGYDSGDMVTVEVTLTRGANIGEWQMNSRLTNVSDGTNFAASSNPTDTVGSVSASTVWDSMDLGGNAFFGLSTFNNTGAVQVSFKSIKLEAGLPPEGVLPTILYAGNFCDFVDGDLSAQDGFEAQLGWTVTGGMATASASFIRARQASPASAFVLDVDETLGIGAELSLTGTPAAPVILTMGFSKSDEHVGATIPQVGASVTWIGNDLTFGGATDTGYDSGDEIFVEFRFTRAAGTDLWMLETTLNNLTDGTSFTGSEMPTDLPGTVTTDTVWSWMENGNSAFFGMGMKDNSGEVTVAFKTVEVITNPEDDPIIEGGDFAAETVTVVRGVQASGDITDLLEGGPENSDLVVQRNPMQTTGVTEIAFKTTSPIQDPTSLSFTLEASGFFRTAVVQSIELYDYDAGAYVEFDSRNTARFVDSVTVATATGDLSRFVDDSTGCVEARVLYTSAVRRQTFSTGIDQVFWTID